jgi:hypothetical protein
MEKRMDDSVGGKTYDAVVRQRDALAASCRELEAENARLNMEMVAYREKLTPADAAAMVAVMNSLYAEKKWRDAQHWGPCGNPPHVKLAESYTVGEHSVETIPTPSSGSAE